MWKFSLLFLMSCSAMMGTSSPKTAKESDYIVNFVSNEWVQKKDEQSDYVWENKSDGSILLSNSFCKEFQDQTLENLALKTFKTVSKLKIESKSYKTFKDREAYRLEGSGTVDGVPVGLILLNTRRNNCYFDFVSITPLKTAKEKPNAFEDFLNSVEFK